MVNQKVSRCAALLKVNAFEERKPGFNLSLVSKDREENKQLRNEKKPEVLSDQKKGL